jgi:hypothetical protein
LFAKSSKIPEFLQLFLFLFLLSGTAEAVSVRTLNLAEMVTLSDRVFLGRVVSVAERYDSRLSTPVTTYTFRVIEGIRGADTGETVQVRQAGSRDGGYSSIAGLPVYRKGQEFLLFLHGNSRFGLTSPVGLLQGVFRAVDLPGGWRGYVNGVDNRNLGMSGQYVHKSLSPEPGEVSPGRSTKAAPVTIRMLKDFVLEMEEKGSKGQ